MNESICNFESIPYPPSFETKSCREIEVIIMHATSSKRSASLAHAAPQPPKLTRAAAGVVVAGKRRKKSVLWGRLFIFYFCRKVKKHKLINTIAFGNPCPDRQLMRMMESAAQSARRKKERS
jgi:hypothetical protein